MISEELLSKLLRGENQCVEFKQSANQREGILRAVCALANDLGDSRTPCHVLIGVDKHGSIVGTNAAGMSLDEQQRTITDWLRSSKLYPTPSFSLHVVEHEGVSLLVLEVTPYSVPPVVQVDGVAWVRQGSTTRQATQADLTRLNERRPVARLPYDTRPVIGATIDDLEVGLLEHEWRASKEGDDDPNSFPDLTSWLGARQLGRLVQGTWTPNAAALLVHGKSPQDWISGAEIDLVRYSGIEIDAPVTVRRRASGTLVDQLEVAWAWVANHVETVPLGHDGIKEGFIATYPLDALKELLRNLVQHRLYEGTNALGRVEWFDDRIEFSNPGGPYGRASEGEFGTHSEYRNPVITGELLRMGYVQQLGRGIRRTRKELEKNGNPPLEVAVDGFTRLVVRSRS